MKANELRIGNYVNLTKDNFKTVNLYQLEGFDIYKLDESECFDIKPIPLTEDWLFKLGFVFKDMTWTYIKLKNNIKATIVFFDCWNIKIEGDGILIEYTGYPKIHELQNMFSIIGEELTINS